VSAGREAREGTAPPLRDQVALVTGGGAGIGRACVERLATSGAHVILFDRNRDRADDVATDARRCGGDVDVVVGDAAEESVVVDAVATTLGRAGRLDILVTCAGGFSHAAPLPDVCLDAWNDAVTANLTATFLACRAVAPAMRRRRYGRIVTVASMAARTALPQAAHPYSAAKAAVVGLTRQLALEVAADGVTVNAVAPGVVLSPRVERRGPEFLAEVNRATPMRRAGTPEEVAAAICFLAGPDAGYITGATLDVNGGRFMG
jgi:NAD(P)-dependent dehydrogenase (short-subunit alcohol dehydrogenase family)